MGRGLITLDTIDTGCDPIKAGTNVTAYLTNNQPDILLGPTCSTSAVRIIEDFSVPKNILTMSSSASYPLLSTIEDKVTVVTALMAEWCKASHAPVPLELYGRALTTHVLLHFDLGERWVCCKTPP